MPEATLISRPLITWGVASRPLRGHDISGDLHLVKPLPGGVLLAVLDGIGHGEEAAAAARAAVDVLETSVEHELPSLVGRCHAALTRTRGVVMTLAFLNPMTGTLTWLGVGNVEALLVRANPAVKPGMERALLRSGLVGYHLPVLRESTVSINPGDLVVFATDGIEPGFAHRWERSAPAQEVADQIMGAHFRGTDDALVLVVRYLEPGYE